MFCMTVDRWTYNRQVKKYIDKHWFQIVTYFSETESTQKILGEEI